MENESGDNTASDKKMLIIEGKEIEIIQSWIYQLRKIDGIGDDEFELVTKINEIAV